MFFYRPPSASASASASASSSSDSVPFQPHSLPAVEEKEREEKQAPAVRRRRPRPADGSSAAAAPVAQRQRTAALTPHERDARNLENAAFALVGQLESFQKVRTTFMMVFTAGCVVFFVKVLSAVSGRCPTLAESMTGQDSKVPEALALLRASSSSSSSSSSSNNTAAADLLEEKQRQYDVLRSQYEELHEELREAEEEVSRLRQELGAQLAGHTRSANHLRDVLHPFFSASSSSSSSHQPGCDCRRCGGRPSSPSYTPTSPPTVAAHPMDCECDGCRTEVE